jgi:hypothetical protein
MTAASKALGFFVIGLCVAYLTLFDNSLYFDHTYCPPLLWRETQKTKLLGATTKNEKLLPCLFLVLGLFFGSNTCR